MNQKKMKDIHLHAKVLLARWLNHLVDVSQREQIPMSEVKKLLPKQEHIQVNGRVVLSAYSFKWVTSALKSLAERSPSRGVDTFTMENVEAYHKLKGSRLNAET
jgi:hypothetical protein